MNQTQKLVARLEGFAGKHLTMDEAELFASELTTRAARQATFAMVGVGEEQIDGRAIASGVTVRDFASRARAALQQANLLQRLGDAKEYQGAWGIEPIDNLREDVEERVSTALATLEAK